ncbi:unnamed protein product [Danaus chrysippus]|uniref:(African queen) hypothetical protein n=1 Tax=Danaus chrysippus TaxID=151541 RepID=A0A8J2QV59_9NEOP|nr:unnamed protein product [Danaus chrysippus]CAG9567332.1 unnamed protein product [Danaus chrysippus]
MVRAPSKPVGDPGSSPGQDHGYEAAEGHVLTNNAINRTLREHVKRSYKKFDCKLIESTITKAQLDSFSPSHHPSTRPLSRDSYLDSLPSDCSW